MPDFVSFFLFDFCPVRACLLGSNVPRRLACAVSPTKMMLSMTRACRVSFWVVLQQAGRSASTTWLLDKLMNRVISGWLAGQHGAQSLETGQDESGHCHLDSTPTTMLMREIFNRQLTSDGQGTYSLSVRRSPANRLFSCPALLVAVYIHTPLHSMNTCK
ncbi:hypothetical protein BC567DRAFT_237508 [Phyllosticta citribraziliensis]